MDLKQLLNELQVLMLLFRIKSLDLKSPLTMAEISLQLVLLALVPLAQSTTNLCKTAFIL